MFLSSATRQFSRISTASSFRCARAFLSSATSDKIVLLERPAPGIAHIILNRHEGKNSLCRALVTELNTAVRTVHDDSSVMVCLISSSVPKIYCAGADLKERATMTEADVGVFVDSLRASCMGVEQLPCVTIAAIEGAALGGGLELALACDLRIASESCLLGLPEVGLAIIPGAGGTQRLPRLIGIPKAKELIFTARKLKSPEAFAMGLVTESVSAGKAVDRAMELATQMTAHGPLGLRMAKRAVDQGMQGSLQDGYAVEKACYGVVLPTADRLEGLKAFAEKRKPVYKGC